MIVLIIDCLGFSNMLRLLQNFKTCDSSYFRILGYGRTVDVIVRLQMKDRNVLAVKRNGPTDLDT